MSVVIIDGRLLRQDGGQVEAFEMVLSAEVQHHLIVRIHSALQFRRGHIPLRLSLWAHPAKQQEPFHSALENGSRSEEHTSELQSRPHLVCRLLLEKKKTPPARPVQP